MSFALNRPQGSRGGWRGGRGRGDFRSTAQKQAAPTSPEPPTGDLIRALLKDDLKQDAMLWQADATITGCQTVASYNWLDRKEPTIVVPGKPPRWTPFDEAKTVKEDKGEYFRDQNGARFPKHPLEPAIAAAAALKPDALMNVDVVACGSTLGNLLRFIRGQDKRFRILVEMVEDTVFFTRRENTPDEKILDVRGFGHSFPEAYTTWDAGAKGSVSHQRLLRYQFGGLDFLVRFEGDGSLASSALNAGDGSVPDSPTASPDDLADSLMMNSVSPATPSTSEPLKIVQTGDAIVDQATIFDLKTRSLYWKGKQDTLADELPRFWIAQIPNFILAYHDKGLFRREEITVQDIRGRVKKWEGDNKPALALLAAVIHRIVDLVRAQNDKKLELRHATPGRLEVREQLQGAGQALSPQVQDLWRTIQRGESVRTEQSDSPERSDKEDDDDDLNWDEGSEKDFTACSLEDCGYCGHCTY